MNVKKIIDLCEELADYTLEEWEDRSLHLLTEIKYELALYALAGNIAIAGSYEEKVNHPSHYQGKSMEVIDVIEAFDCGFLLGNVLKYVLRAGKKGDRKEDLKKAMWYLQREIDRD